MQQRQALHQSLHMKISVYKTSTEAKFRSKEPRAGGVQRKRRRATFGADWELCMKWKFLQCDEQICVCMGMLIIISGEICQFIFSHCSMRI